MNKISNSISTNYNFPTLKTKRKEAGDNFAHNNPIKIQQNFEQKAFIDSLKAQKLAFLGKPKEIVTPEILYKKIKRQSLNISEKDVRIIFNNIKEKLAKEGVEAKDEDILKTMWTLTQWGNIEGIKNEEL